MNLFAGFQTWLYPWRLEGAKTWATDIVDRPGIDLAIDILDLKLSDIPFEPGEIDLLVASPDCTAFSKGSIGTHWAGGAKAYVPATDKALNRMLLVHALVGFIKALRPRYAVIENPIGMLGVLGILDDYERREVWYCHYGESDRAKPTHLWGAPFPPGFVTRPTCHNRRPEHPYDCCCRDHDAAPRGAKTGTQGRPKDDRSFIPFDLASDLMWAVLAEQEAVA